MEVGWEDKRLTMVVTEMKPGIFQEGACGLDLLC